MGRVPQPDTAVANMNESLPDPQHYEETPPSSPEGYNRTSSPGSGSDHMDSLIKSLMAEMPVASSNPLSSPFSPSAHQEDYLGTQVKREQDSQAEESTTKREPSSSSCFNAEETHPSLTRHFSSLSPLSSLGKSPSPVPEASKTLKRKVKSITPATKKRKINPEDSIAGNSSPLHHNAVIKQEDDEPDSKRLGRLARDIGHEVRKRSTRTAKTKTKKPATIKAKTIKVEDVKTEITTSHQAHTSLPETEDDSMESDDFEDAVEYIQDPLAPSLIGGPMRPYSFHGGKQTARKPTIGVIPPGNPQAQSSLSETEDDSTESENCEDTLESMNDQSAPSIIRESRRPYHFHGGMQTARKSTPGVKIRRLRKKLEHGKRSESQPVTSTPDARLTRSKSGDDAKFMALDSDNTPTSVDNILLDLESIDRQHRLMMKMRKQAKARREGRVK